MYDGDDSAAEGSGPGPVGSAEIEDVFEGFFAARGEATKAADFTGRSDYGPFIAVGIPAGGLFTGAEAHQDRQPTSRSGAASRASRYDPCYHDPCDSLTPEQDGAPAGVHDALDASDGYDLFGNLNTFAFDVNADAIATAVITFAYDTSTVNGGAGATAAAVTAKAAGRGATDIHGHATR